MGLPIQGETDGSVITGNRCMANVPSGTWENTHHETQITDEGKFALTTNSFLKCEYGGIIRVKTSGQETVIKDEDISDMTQYELPKEAQAEVEAIIASDEEWETKSDKIRQVYEKSLYNYNDEVKAAFDAYGEKLLTNDTDVIKRAQNELKQTLNSTGIDIKSVGRALSEDILRVVPQNNTNVADELCTFATLVKPYAPMDLKNQCLSKSTGNSDLEFSIWSLPWEDSESGETIRSDYMGNYTFGYLGAGYFRNIDFDNATSIAAMTTLPTGVLNSAAAGLTTKCVIDNLRGSNTDKTDAEIMCLMAGGVAQLYSDQKSDKYSIIEATTKYYDSLVEGNWGDNKDDSKFSSEGFDDYYSRNGLNKDKIIEKKRVC